MTHHLKKLLNRESFGLVLRVFAGKPESVASQCDRTLALARKAAALEVDGNVVFKSILVVVASDTRRVDHDCGDSYPYLKEALRKDPCKQIAVINGERDDLFCGILNQAAAELLRRGCSYMGVFSHAAHDYLDMQFLEAASEAFTKGAAAAGLAITELQESILRGELANTGMIWDLHQLVAVGGFDHYAEQPFKAGHQGLFTNERLVEWVQTSQQNGGFYPSAGVEEIIPLIRIARRLDRPCIAPIMPSSGRIWEMPADPDELVRHLKKMATKTTRKAGMARHVNADLCVLEEAVMPDYIMRS